MDANLQAARDPRHLALSSCTVDIAARAEHVTITINGELDMADADQVTRVLLEAPTLHLPVRVDLAGLTFADSAALKALLLGAMEAERCGTSFRVVNPHPSVVRLFEVTGLTEALRVTQEPDATSS